MSVDPLVLLAIAAMAVVTYATRVGGWLTVRRLTVTGRMRAALDAVPAAVLMAVIAPMALASGPAETLAAAATAVSAIYLPRLVTIVLGVAAVVALRAAMYGA